MRSTDFTKNDCNHFIFKDISRIFVTKIGSVKFSYEETPLYLIDSSPLTEKDVKNMIFVKTIYNLNR